MPRPSYEEHRARKRRQSFDETDAGSLASFTTHQSSSSFQPTYTYASSSRLVVPKPRTLSSTSASSATSPRLQSFVAHPASRPQNPSLLSVNGTDEATLKRREARRLRREERERKSTLRGDEFDTRLRRVVRWISKKGWRGRSIALTAVVWVLLRVVMERNRLGHNLTLHRYKFETIVDRIPYIGHMLVGFSTNNFLSLLVFLNITAELLLWSVGVIRWTRKQGGIGGRSWRSQVIAAISILLAPAFFLASTQHIILPHIPLGLCTTGIYFLPDVYDQSASDPFLIATILDPRWGVFLPVILTFITARCFSQGLLKGTWTMRHAVISPLRLFVIKSFFEGTFSRKTYPVLNEGFMVKWIFDSMVKKDGLCAPYSPNVWCTTNIIFKWASWLSATTINTIALVLLGVTLAPILGIVFYTAYSTPPTPARTPHPGANILPIALFTSSLSLIILLPNMRPEALVVPLLPLSLMSCMRGGKDDLGDGAEWEWTVLLHTVVTFYLAATSHAGAQSLGVPALILWNYLLSSRSLPRDMSSLRKCRRTIEMSCACTYAITYLISPSSIPFYEEGWCVLVLGVLVAAWMWGASRLYLTAWASGALGQRNF